MMHLVATSTSEVEVHEGWLRRCAAAFVKVLGNAGLTSRDASKRHMRIVETLPLGAKKQLLLVSCDGEQFLIGTGAESVQSILRVRSASEPAGELS